MHKYELPIKGIYWALLGGVKDGRYKIVDGEILYLRTWNSWAKSALNEEIGQYIVGRKNDQHNKSLSHISKGQGQV